MIHLKISQNNRKKSLSPKIQNKDDMEQYNKGVTLGITRKGGALWQTIASHVEHVLFFAVFGFLCPHRFV